ncbi:hypothetical protein RKD42_007360 [Streptomyces ambofaciens]
MLDGSAQPLRDHRAPHHHIADHDECEVTVLEHGGHTGCQDEHAGHLQQRQKPVRHIVGVVGRGEPGEVHPRPPDREEHRRIGSQPRTDMAFGEGVMKLGHGLGDGDHEGQIEQQLQRRRRPVSLPRIPPAHHPPQHSRRGGIGLAAHHVFLPQSVGVTDRPLLPARSGRHRHRRRASRSAQRGIDGLDAGGAGERAMRPGRCSMRESCPGWPRRTASRSPRPPGVSREAPARVSRPGPGASLDTRAGRAFSGWCSRRWGTSSGR